MTTVPQKISINLSSNSRSLVCIAVICSVASTSALAQTTTSLGNGALSAGVDNTGLGYHAGMSTTGTQITAVGSLALENNTAGTNNTATGHAALQGSIVVDSSHSRIPNNGSRNTANGDQAIASIVAGNDNTATGYRALLSDLWGNNNTAVGSEALRYNRGAQNTNQSCYNTAVGMKALWGSTSYSTGSQNTATGSQALMSYSTGSGNTADGYAALINRTCWKQKHCRRVRSTGCVEEGRLECRFGPRRRR